MKMASNYPNFFLNNTLRPQRSLRRENRVNGIRHGHMLPEGNGAPFWGLWVEFADTPR